MWQDVLTLFSEMGPIPAILLFIGIVFCIIEMFQPGIGFFGIAGSILTVAGIVLRFVYNFNLTQLFVLVLIIAIILTVAAVLIVHSAKKGWLSKTPLINNSTALPVNFENNEMQQLVGKVGITITECKPTGKAEIDGNQYDVISQGEFINKGTSIEITQINNNNIIIKVKEEE